MSSIIAARIRGAKIDALVGRKACDVLFSFGEFHEPLATFCRINPAQGDLVAIEVEVRDPRKTAPNNIARNTEAGVAHTIIATTTPLRSPLGAIIVDVFDLLEALHARAT